jgi:Kef-type K+ transport system membrane component KefB
MLVDTIAPSQWRGDSNSMTNCDTSVWFFLQIAAILVACRLVGMLAKKLGQPEAVGHMVAGVALGPSVLGVVSHGAEEWLFPEKSRTVIYVVAQVGLALYMFLVGLEFRTDLWGDSIGRMEAMLFLGTAMSITAFPMMARIIAERGLSDTSIGTLLLAAGSIGDVLAWCVLAGLLSALGDGWIVGAKAVGGGVAYVAVAVLVLRPLLRWMARESTPGTGAGAKKGAGADEWPVSPDKFLVVLIFLAAASWFTDWIGVYAVFGAFVLGLVVPRGAFATGLHRMLLPVASGVLVPMFFVSSGLNTRVTLLDSWALWGIAGLVVGAACIGKLVACTVAARWSGESVRDSLAIGAMMNARGLMELILLNIGLERGIITPTLFSIGVTMAIVTTLMATPLFDLAYRRRAGEAGLGRGSETRNGRIGDGPTPDLIEMKPERRSDAAQNRPTEVELRNA